MEIRALAIAFFYAVGTAIGGITGPLVFERLGESGDTGQVMIAYLIGAAVMAFGGIVELIVGVRAEQKPLEDIAEPLTAAGAEPEPTPERKAAPRRPARRWRLGPGSTSFSPFPPPPGSSAPAGLEREVAEIRRALDERGVLSRRELAARTRARRWGPGRFSAALGAALDAGAVRRVGWSRFAPVRTPGP